MNAKAKFKLQFEHIDNLENNLNSKTNNQDNNSLQHLYSKEIGNFTSMITDHYLSHLPWNSERSFYLKYTVTNLQPGQVSKSLIEQLLFFFFGPQQGPDRMKEKTGKTGKRKTPA